MGTGHQGAKRARVLDADHGRQILARGEVTGHHHSFPASAGTLWQDEGGVTYMTIEQLTEVSHQEHGPITVAPGTYRVTRQREYTPERAVYVGD